MFHRVFYAHRTLDKDKVGSLTLCISRLRPSRGSYWFSPDFTGSHDSWYPVRDPDTLIAILRSSSAFEAMAAVRRQGAAPA